MIEVIANDRMGRKGMSHPVIFMALRLLQWTGAEQGLIPDLSPGQMPADRHCWRSEKVDCRPDRYDPPKDPAQEVVSASARVRSVMSCHIGLMLKQ